MARSLCDTRDQMPGTAVFDNLQIGVPSVLSNDTDIDVGTNLAVHVYSTTSARAEVVTMNSDGTFAYDPRAVAAFIALPRGTTTTDSFTYTAIDGNGGSASATVNVTVLGVNNPPTAVAEIAIAPARTMCSPLPLPR